MKYALMGLILLVHTIFLTAIAVAQTPTAIFVDRSPHQEKFVTANDIKIYYLDWGGKGDALVFLTGMGTTPHIFDDLAPKFTNKFRVYGLTRRGMGKSDKPASGYDMATLAEDIRGFLDAMKIKRATLVGWSLGGLEATEFASRYPERVKRIVYLDSAYDYSKFAPLWSQDPIANQPSKEDLASFESAKKWFIRTQGMWSDGIEADAREINLQPDGSVRIESMSPEINKQLFETLGSTKPDFTKIKVPVLAFYAITPTHPFVQPETPEETKQKGEKYWRELHAPQVREQMANFKKAVPQAKIVEMNTVHMNFIKPEDAEIVLREMLAFLK